MQFTGVQRQIIADFREGIISALKATLMLRDTGLSDETISDILHGKIDL